MIVFWSGSRSIKKIAAAYEYQLMETLPSEAHDVPVDMVVTEKQCCICRTGEE